MSFLIKLLATISLRLSTRYGYQSMLYKLYRDLQENFLKILEYYISEPLLTVKGERGTNSMQVAYRKPVF